MAFSDPQTIEITPDTFTLPRVGSGPNSGTFSTADQEVKLLISHAVNKRVRRQIRLDTQKVIPDPLFPASNTPRSMSVYLVVDAPLTGYTISEMGSAAGGLCSYLTASSGAKLLQFLGGEA